MNLNEYKKLYMVPEELIAPLPYVKIKFCELVSFEKFTYFKDLAAKVRNP